MPNYFSLLSKPRPGSTASSVNYLELFSGRSSASGVDPGRNEREAGYLPASDIESIYGPLPGSSRLPDPGWLGMLLSGAKEGFGGPLVGLAEWANLVDEGTRIDMREDFEKTREGYLAADPTATRAAIAGAAEIGGAALPILPTSAIARGAGTALSKLGVNASAKALTTGALATEGALIGLGETAGQDPLNVALGVGIGTLGGGVAGRAVARSKAPFMERLSETFSESDKFLKKWFAEGGLVGRESSDRVREAHGLAQDRILSAREKLERLEGSVYDHVESSLPNGGRQADAYQEKLFEDINEAMIRRPEGGGPEAASSLIDSLPDGVRPIVREMRDDVDDLSEFFATNPYLSKELRKVVAENSGVYLHRSYRAFGTDREWQGFIDGKGVLPEMQAKRQKIITDAKEFVRQELDGHVPVEQLDDMVDGTLRSMLDNPYNAMEVLGSRPAGAGKIDGRIFKHRKDIDPVIQNYLGLHTDIRNNYMRSVSYMAHDMELQKAYQDVLKFVVDGPDSIAKMGMLVNGKWVRPDETYRFTPRISKGAGDPISGMTTLYEKRVAKGGASDALVDPLDNIVEAPSTLGRIDDDLVPHQARPFFRSQEEADAFGGLVEASRLNGYQTLNAITKLMKTVGSPQTHARNWLSGHFMMLLQGHFPSFSAYSPSKWQAVGAGNRMRKPLGDVWTTEAMGAYRELLRRGVVGEGVQAKELEFFLRQSQRYLDDKTPIRKVLKKSGEWVASAYKAEDDFWKVNLFLRERKRYHKHIKDHHYDMPEVEYNKLLDRMAGDVVDDTMQIYSKVPLAVKKLREFIGLGPFVSFPAEIMRNVLRTGQLIIREWKDPILRPIAMQRMMGGGLALGASGPAFMAAGRWISGVDQEKQQAVKEFVAPWSKHSDLVMLPGADEEKGNFRYVDLSFMDPYNIIKKPLAAFYRGVTSGDMEVAEAALEGIKELADPFVGPEIIWSELLKAYRTSIKESEATKSRKTATWTNALYRAFAPGAMISGERILRSHNIGGVKEVLPQTNQYGRTYKPRDEWMAMLGPRLSEVNVPQSFQYRARDYSSARRQASGIYSKEARNTSSRSAYKLMGARQEAEATNKKSAEELLVTIENARRTGMNNLQIMRQLINAGVSKSDAKSLIFGQIPQLRLR